MPSPRYTVRKPGIPSLWLDTSVLLKLAKVRRGERLSGSDELRVRRLDELATNAVRAGKLVCVESHQRDEFAGGRLESETLDAHRSLSLTIRLRSMAAVQDAQLVAAMRAYLSGAPVTELGIDVFFDEDPLVTLKRIESQGWFLSVDLAVPAQFRELREAAKQRVWVDHEALRQRLVAQGVTYEEQLAQEYKGYLQGILGLLEDAAGADASKKLGPLAASTMAFEHILSLIRTWESLGGRRDDISAFMDSEHHAAIPIRRVESQLLACMVTGNDRVKPSDSDDVSHLAMAIPISHFVVADVAMERRVKALGIDQEWGTEVYSLRSIDRLFERIAAL